MKRILSLLLIFGTCATLRAAEAVAKVYDPAGSPASGPATTPGSSVLVSVIYLLFMAGLAWAVYLFWRKKNVPVHTTRAHARVLDVTATRPLGNRQFLVVVRYGKKELLLGVGQGFITPLQTDEYVEFEKKGAQ